jgi:hypothetical protein
MISPDLLVELIESGPSKVHLIGQYSATEAEVLSEYST